MRQAIADVGLDVDETAREAKTQHAAALREWSAEWDSDAAPGESEPSEQADAPSKDGESESHAADAETEDADDVPPSLHFSDPPNPAQQLFEAAFGGLDRNLCVFFKDSSDWPSGNRPGHFLGLEDRSARLRIRTQNHRLRLPASRDTRGSFVVGHARRVPIDRGSAA